jgi:hypothetical protein
MPVKIVNAAEWLIGFLVQAILACEECDVRYIQFCNDIYKPKIKCLLFRNKAFCIKRL